MKEFLRNAEIPSIDLNGLNWHNLHKWIFALHKPREKRLPFPPGIKEGSPNLARRIKWKVIERSLRLIWCERLTFISKELKNLDSFLCSFFVIFSVIFYVKSIFIILSESKQQSIKNKSYQVLSFWCRWCHVKLQQLTWTFPANKNRKFVSFSQFLPKNNYTSLNVPDKTKIGYKHKNSLLKNIKSYKLNLYRN